MTTYIIRYKHCRTTKKGGTHTTKKGGAIIKIEYYDIRTDIQEMA